VNGGRSCIDDIGGSVDIIFEQLNEGGERMCEHRFFVGYINTSYNEISWG